jgi:hypothetical protein
MAPDGSGGGTVFAVVCNLPPGCAAPGRLARAATRRHARAAPRRGALPIAGAAAAAWERGGACGKPSPPRHERRRSRRAPRRALSAPRRARSYHQYKFIVDGKWQHEEGQAFVTDPLGNTNNWRVSGEPRGRPLAAAARRARVAALRRRRRARRRRLYVKRPEPTAPGAGAWAGEGRAAASGAQPWLATLARATPAPARARAR